MPNSFYQSPTERAVCRALQEDGIAGTIAVPAAAAYVVFLTAPFACVISGIETQLSAGTLTVAVRVAGVNVAGLSAIAATTALLRTDPTQFTTTAQVQPGDLVEVVCSAPAAAADFSYVLYYKRPGD